MNAGACIIYLAPREKYFSDTLQEYREILWVALCVIAEGCVKVHMGPLNYTMAKYYYSKYLI